MLRSLSFFGLTFLLVWSCQKKKITPEKNHVLPIEVEEIKKQYEKTEEAQNLALSLDWEKADLQKNQETKIIKVPLKDQKNTYLIGINHNFWYRRILKRSDGEQTINLIYDAEGFLKIAIHAHERVDFYSLKNEAYNFYEHHINSKSSKYQNWENFDFLDFEYVESLKDLSSLVYKNTNLDCHDIFMYITDELEEPYSNLAFWDCIDNAFCVCARSRNGL